MERPVYCHFCKRKMYYSGHPLHETEVRIDIVDEQRKKNKYFYAHKKCFRKFFLKKRFLFAEYPHHLQVKERLESDA